MGRVVGRVECGHKLVLSEEQTCFFYFHDFENLKGKRGDYIASPPIVCHGIEWSVWIFPFGDKDSKEGFTGIFLKPLLRNDNDEVRAKFEMGISNTQIKPLDESMPVRFSKGVISLGYPDYIKRSEVFDSTNGHLIDGTLRVQVNIQVYMDKPVPWVPQKRLSRGMLKMLESGEFSDVTFMVGEQEYPLHLTVLKLRAPVLAALGEDFARNNEPIPLDIVDPDIFQLFLSFLYSDELPTNVNFSKHAKKILDMADKFGSSDLKLVAESELVKLGITTDNAADLLLYADAKNCAALRETAMDFICGNTTAVMQTKGWDNIKQSLSLSTEIMDKTLGNNKKRKLSHKSQGGKNFDNMSVMNLRQKLWDLGLDIDGSREILVGRLTAAMASKK